MPGAWDQGHLAVIGSVAIFDAMMSPYLGSGLNGGCAICFDGNGKHDHFQSQKFLENGLAREF